ncbi:hypothetical protein H6P81_006148 [Aristolochia fimbriata]|uniref:RING-CH-type domain-containing protein n=1 Tax=Aristolochia fimbriata TaxID=158543 RepID=A0AAV7EXN7_ARIFI|nr:hypothetical protein H6P81_006148 [Aristolochia fimbriata]
MATVAKSHERVTELTSRRAGGGDTDESVCFSDAEEDSWHSPYGSRNGGSYDEHRFSGESDPEIGGASEARRSFSVSESCAQVDLESGLAQTKVHLAKVEKDCRICHLSLESANQESGIPIELGCSCKDDLAAAHKQCAEAWFKIKGNKTCEICGATAKNVVGVNETEFLEQWNETTNPVAAPPQETRSFWHGHRFLNFLLACMVFAFVISWLFHFNVPS